MSTSTEGTKKKGGRITDLTPMLVDTIVSNVPNVYFIRPVSVLSGVSETNLSRWLIRGEKELNDNQDTIYSELWVRFNAAKYGDSRDMLIRLKECPRNYGALTFILERCFKEDFAQKSDTQMRLEDIVFNQIAPMLNKDPSNGSQETEELHQESDQTPRCIA